ncbi:TonB-dependent receptor [soil metagenome]
MSVRYAACATCALIVSAPALSQSGNVDRNGNLSQSHIGIPSDPDGRLQEIVVTARRVSERLQDVPISVTALSPSALQSRGITNVFDLQFSSPSLVVNNTQASGRLGGRYVIRGQGAAADDAPPGVVTYLNDVPVYSYTVSRNFFDLQDIQVLKGPQGTLFGRNTNGGAVLYNTKKPMHQWEGYATARYGALDERMLEGVLNIPITEGLALRFGGNIVRRNGFTRNSSGADLDNQHYENARVSLLFEPDGNFSNILVYSYTNIDEIGPGNVLSQVVSCAEGGTADCLYPGAGGIQAAYDEVKNGKRRVNVETPGFQAVKTHSLSNTSEVNIGDNLSVKNVFGYISARYQGSNNFTNTTIPILSVNYSQYSRQLTEELQFRLSMLDDALKVIAGGFYLSSKGDPFKSSRTLGATNDGGIALPFLFRGANFSHFNDDSRALFAQGTLKLSPTLTLNAGYRYTWDTSRLSGGQFRTYFPENVVGVAVPPGQTLTVCSLDISGAPVPGISVDPLACDRRAKAKFSAGNYIVGLDWKLDRNTLLYIAHRKGYKSGGFNSTSSLATGDFIYGPEKLLDVEAGIKTQFSAFSVPVRLNIAGFHDWYQNLQLTVLVNASSGPQSLTQSVGRARLWGLEGEVTILPAAGVSLGASFGYFDGKFGKGQAADSVGNVVDLKGVPYGSAPKFTYGLNGAYTVPIAGGGEVSGSIFYAWRSGYFANFERIVENRYEKNGILNGRLQVIDFHGSGLDIALYGRNLTNKAYTLGIITGGAFGFRARYYGEPRTYGIETTYHF